LQTHPSYIHPPKASPHNGKPALKFDSLSFQFLVDVLLRLSDDRLATLKVSL
jgi:hypothetical protein